MSLQVFWGSLFILAKSVLKQITSLSRNFLWNGNESDSLGAKVAWADITKPATEGGGEWFFGNGRLN